MNERPYWLSGGTETCGLCTHTTVLEMVYRCAGCDRGMCEHCVVVLETRVVLCEACASEEEES
jgi:hypothetical protein